MSLAGASFLQCTPYHRCMVPRRRRSIAWLSVGGGGGGGVVFDLSEEAAEGGSGLKHRSDVESIT